MIQKLSPGEHLRRFNTSTDCAPVIYKCFLCLKLNGNTALVRLNFLRTVLAICRLRLQGALSHCVSKSTYLPMQKCNSSCSQTINSLRKKSPVVKNAEHHVLTKFCHLFYFLVFNCICRFYIDFYVCLFVFFVHFCMCQSQVKGDAKFMKYLFYFLL